ncbi:MAG: 5'-nucleotidase C-terminal domain-containing protein [Opitutaceae bacterium]|nr:5'-nucleotidase C-terminal domain-containing protein [Opitutaceae bacterium]
MPSSHSSSLPVAVRLAAFLSTLPLVSSFSYAEGIKVLHVGDQESWLVSAQGNLRDNASQALSFYGGVDRLAQVISNARVAAASEGRFVVTLNAGDALLPGPRFTASFEKLGTAYSDGGQDFFDAIALRQIGFDAAVFGNHEFDEGPGVAARFAKVSETPYLSINLNFNATPEFAALKASGKVGASRILTTPGGKKIGLIGVTTPLLPTISSPGAVNLINHNPANTEVQNLNALLPLIQAEIDDLRNNKGASLVIVMSHLQNSQNERTIMVPGLTGVDLVLSGGGHELMTDPDDVIIPGAIAPTFATHPIYATDASGKKTPIVTSHFGNRYVGEVNLTIDDTTGMLVSIDSTKMRRVSGFAADADKVSPDTQLNEKVVKPVLDYIAVLNAQIIGTTAVKLNGPTHVPGTPGNYIEGVRNAETALGNLVTDALRFAGGTDVAVQNGGGIRANITAVGNVSVGDTFNVLPFTNLLKRAPSVNATQLKAVLETAYNATSPSGAAQGRFAQVSGFKVWYNSTNPIGNRIVKIVLDDGTVLVEGGAVVSPRTFSLSTIDFLANGGDSYPFVSQGVVFENAVSTVTYQEALANFIETPKSAGGLGRVNAADGDEITANVYGEENAFDLHGRIIDLAVGLATPGVTLNGKAGRDTINGTDGDDVITGGGAGDLLTGKLGGDTFVYLNARDSGDVITDFTPYADQLDLKPLLKSLGYTGSDPLGAGYVKLVDQIGGVSLQIDNDGPNGSQPFRAFLTLKGMTASQFVAARDLKK